MNTSQRWEEALLGYGLRLLTPILIWTWQRQYLHNSATLRLQLTELFATSLHFSSFPSVIGSLPLTWGDGAM